VDWPRPLLFCCECHCTRSPPSLLYIAHVFSHGIFEVLPSSGTYFPLFSCLHDEQYSIYTSMLHNSHHLSHSVYTKHVANRSLLTYIFCLRCFRSRRASSPPSPSSTAEKGPIVISPVADLEPALPAKFTRLNGEPAIIVPLEPIPEVLIPSEDFSTAPEQEDRGFSSLDILSTIEEESLRGSGDVRPTASLEISPPPSTVAAREGPSRRGLPGAFTPPDTPLPASPAPQPVSLVSRIKAWCWGNAEAEAQVDGAADVRRKRKRERVGDWLQL
jgi:hypothetical protein